MSVGTSLVGAADGLRRYAQRPAFRFGLRRFMSKPHRSLPHSCRYFLGAGRALILLRLQTLQQARDDSLQPFTVPKVPIHDALKSDTCFSAIEAQVKKMYLSDELDGVIELERPEAPASAAFETVEEFRTYAPAARR